MLFLFLLVLGLLVAHRFYYFQLDRTYAQGTCTIEAARIYHKNYGDGQNEEATLPDFTYQVKTRDGRLFEASGYSGPLHYYTFQPQEAQKIVSDYAIGKQYPCWYDPFLPSQAVLAFNGLDQFAQVVVLGSLINLLAGLLIGLGLLLLFSVYQDLMERRGKVQRRGKVMRYQDVIEWEQIYTVSVIVFRLFWHQKTFELPGVLPLGSRVPLIYHPRKDSIQVGRLPSLFRLFCLLICGCGLILLTIVGFRLFNLTEMDRNFWGWSSSLFKEITQYLPLVGGSRIRLP
ncbi:hypothetical protein KSF_064000 [Reticulibacter mediterranei]|uniref:DUF3592 domain-containing protein n=1 Tax=Reticulibacter mediterranei TaxID=2778369 RepID=A0A8J3N2V6_9CHLR|nr:hypothetical protein KSF_064000 [Reticulibacter mediterranei]